mmetsp:Transcript_13102/g.55323  ORF Transcript_13102/g.55323 Transcript_13102/m.55323 type:complete len:348 (+) Transcript_13102:584-1627(+)
MNVDWPAMMLSLAPMRTKIASAAVIVNEAAGTSAPTCAMIAARHACRISVDLPPMLGPVRSRNGASSPPPSLVSLGTNDSPDASAGAHGCRSRTASSDGGPEPGAITEGVHDSGKVPAISSACSASDDSASSAAAASAARRHLGQSSQNLATSARSTFSSASSLASPAASRSALSASSSGQSNFSKPLRLPSLDQSAGTLPASASLTSHRCVSLFALTRLTSCLDPPSFLRVPTSHSRSASSAAHTLSSAASTASSAPGLGSIRPDSRAASQSKARSKNASRSDSSGVDAPAHAPHAASFVDNASASSSPSVTIASSAGDSRRERTPSKARTARRTPRTPSSARRNP